MLYHHHSKNITTILDSHWPEIAKHSFPVIGFSHPSRLLQLSFNFHFRLTLTFYFDLTSKKCNSVFSSFVLVEMSSFFFLPEAKTRSDIFRSLLLPGTAVNGSRLTDVLDYMADG